MAKGEILIVGAGPVGLTMALELLRHGVPCYIVDQAPYNVGDSRAVGIHARTLEIFEDMDLLPEILKKGGKGQWNQSLFLKKTPITYRI